MKMMKTGTTEFLQKKEGKFLMDSICFDIIDAQELNNQIYELIEVIQPTNAH